jgi:hypothetical protein
MAAVTANWGPGRPFGDPGPGCQGLTKCSGGSEKGRRRRIRIGARRKVSLADPGCFGRRAGSTVKHATATHAPKQDMRPSEETLGILGELSLQTGWLAPRPLQHCPEVCCRVLLPGLGGAVNRLAETNS